MARFRLVRLLCLGLAIVYSFLGAFAAISGQLFGTLANCRWTYLLIGNLCLFFGLAMLEAVPLSPPAFLNRLKVRDVPGHDVLTSVLLGGASALVVSTCTTPILAVLLTLVAARQNVAWGIGLLFAFSYGLGALVIRGWNIHGAAQFPAALRRLVSKGPEVFRPAHDLAAEYYFIKTGELWL